MASTVASKLASARTAVEALVAELDENAAPALGAEGKAKALTPGSRRLMDPAKRAAQALGVGKQGAYKDHLGVLAGLAAELDTYRDTP